MFYTKKRYTNTNDRNIGGLYMKNKIIWGILLTSLSLGIIGLFYFGNEVPTETKVTHFKEQLQETEQEKTDEDIKEDKQTNQKEEDDRSTVLNEKLEDVMQHAKQIIARKTAHIVAIGDSLTEGVGDETEQGGYVGVFKEKIREDKLLAQIENLGKRGNRTSQLIERLDEPDIQNKLEQADIILITIGANDVMYVLKQNITNITHKPFEEEKPKYKERLESIFHTIRNINNEAEIYLIGFYNPFAGYFPDIEELEVISEEWNKVGESVTKQFPKTYFVPTADLFKGQSKEVLADDHFHPNQLGYQYIAERILKYLNNNP
ncbi:hypothetical protein FHP05_04080 [Cerasibacillus terrae]|uniref:SGNH hydrolase-type esterase domain-containing protein n=2 Tax=Cerasibacillus terrae TaxID=2498845 RepID=A0A5C8NZL3_9BACI|nr:hypothetical protein FHP05_04080 [Cerasibacillus terrae]